MKSKKVAIQGIAGSFHEQAATKYFETEIQIIPSDTFKTLCIALDTDQADYAVMAIENTLGGSMLPNYSLLQEYHFKIIGEVFLHIQMNLMALPGTPIAGLEAIYSHPMAIRQCAEFLSQMPQTKIVQKNDTADSARQIATEKITNAAAIAGQRAAQMYGLQILEHGIETNKKNYTRFLILAKHGNQSPQNNKASICFELGHYVGSLSAVLSILTKYQINLTKIQSVPVPGKPYEYAFHLDLEWENTENYERAIHAILKQVSNLTILGEYPKGEFHLSSAENVRNGIINV